MDDKETAAYLRKWVTEKGHGPFHWPTDACGYGQHMRFVDHRNANWDGGDRGAYHAFVLAYADTLDPPTPAAGEGSANP